MRQNVSGFRRGLFTCFLGHTSLLPAFWATPHYNNYKEPMLALLTAIQQQGVPEWLVAQKAQDLEQR